MNIINKQFHKKVFRSADNIPVKGQRISAVHPGIGSSWNSLDRQNPQRGQQEAHINNSSKESIKSISTELEAHLLFAGFNKSSSNKLCLHRCLYMAAE